MFWFCFKNMESQNFLLHPEFLQYFKFLITRAAVVARPMALEA